MCFLKDEGDQAHIWGGTCDKKGLSHQHYDITMKDPDR